MKYLAYGTLIQGMLTLAQGAVAFYLRINLFTGTRYGPSLMPVYIIFTGVGVCVAGLAFKTIADRRNQKEQQPANNEQPQSMKFCQRQGATCPAPSDPPPFS